MDGSGRNSQPLRIDDVGLTQGWRNESEVNQHGSLSRCVMSKEIKRRRENREEKKLFCPFSFLLFVSFQMTQRESEWRSEVATWREKDRTRNYRTPADIDIPA